jgi:uncharacterized membrane protein
LLPQEEEGDEEHTWQPQKPVQESTATQNDEEDVEAPEVSEEGEASDQDDEEAEAESAEEVAPEQIQRILSGLTSDTRISGELGIGMLFLVFALTASKK